MTDFSYAESGITRFPPNIEQLRVERGSTVTWLIARRNDVELRFPLKEEDCRYLARLLLGDMFGEREPFVPHDKAKKIVDDFYAGIEQYAPPCVQAADREKLIDAIKQALEEAAGTAIGRSKMMP